MTNKTDSYFGFLKDFDFKGPISYGYSREYHIDYVKGNLIIKILWDGDPCVALLKTKKIFPGLEPGIQKSVDIDFRDYLYYDLKILDYKKRRFNSTTTNERIEDKLLYYSNLLKKNNEILQGDLRNFYPINRFLRWIGINR